MKSLGGAALLLAVLSGCGGGSDGAAQDTAPAATAAGLEEESGAAPTAKPAATPGTRKIDPSLIPEPGAPLVRETYDYLGGSRDPFASVLEGAQIGPELADLDLVAVLYQETAHAASVAVLRDRTSGKRYTIREGERVGRARVADIREKDVSFTIDDYGTTRRVTLSIRKREDTTP